MGAEDPIITPVPGKDPKSIGNRCAMIGNPVDMDNLCNLMQTFPLQSRRWMLSQIYYKQADHPEFSIIGPFIGAPYAVMLLETAGIWGVKEVVFFGWCGAVSPDIHIGDIVIPDTAFIDEGTSKNYITKDETEISPSLNLQNRLKERLHTKKIGFYEGPVWTTDAIFRETRQKVAYFQNRKTLAVEMEASALFTVGRFRSISIGCILVVSDEVNADKWGQGFHNPRFKTSRQHVTEIVRDFLTDHKH